MTTLNMQSNDGSAPHAFTTQKQLSDSVSNGEKGQDNLDNVKTMYFAFFTKSC